MPISVDACLLKQRQILCLHEGHSRFHNLRLGRANALSGLRPIPLKAPSLLFYGGNQCEALLFKLDDGQGACGSQLPFQSDTVRFERCDL